MFACLLIRRPRRLRRLRRRAAAAAPTTRTYLPGLLAEPPRTRPGVPVPDAEELEVKAKLHSLIIGPVPLRGGRGD
ncbi:hypothetical protein [Streptomyces benahoarensis]|uniref:Uncharacterized protein n=1 Tax=Streptomyces benahoarensis TaxID=2595054 RepID=A0A553YX12_9ACTN|nr:hypothetical protein [Streptomyces benahoarensis]TSB17771.1 hypothetical protein FNJ62_26485 [Streptomyces benahoarensis]TSB33533.1 hypothetical protein FNZ23_23420 [Streptomyces benahoarensis]